MAIPLGTLVGNWRWRLDFHLSGCPYGWTITFCATLLYCRTLVPGLCRPVWLLLLLLIALPVCSRFRCFRCAGFLSSSSCWFLSTSAVRPPRFLGWFTMPLVLLLSAVCSARFPCWPLVSARWVCCLWFLCWLLCRSSCWLCLLFVPLAFLRCAVIALAIGCATFVCAPSFLLTCKFLVGAFRGLPACQPHGASFSKYQSFWLVEKRCNIPVVSCPCFTRSFVK